MAVARAVWNQIQSSDHRLMKRVHRWPAPRWFRIFMTCATRLGDGWLWYAVGIMLVFFGGPSRFSAIGAAGLAALPAWRRCSGSCSSAFSSESARGNGHANSSRTAGRSLFRPTSSPFLQDTRSPLSLSPWFSVPSIPICNCACSLPPQASRFRALSWECTF